VVDLCDLWLKLPGVDPVALDRYGVAFKAVQKVGGIRQGKRGWLLPVYVDPPSIFRTVGDPVLEDVVAFDPARPSRYRTIYGAAVMLGEAAFEEARLYRLPLPIFKTPMGWLQAAGAGCCPLDAGAFARQMLGCDLRLVAEDVAHGEDLQRIIDRARRILCPSIWIRKAAA
jgi:hypothetical protein